MQEKSFPTLLLLISHPLVCALQWGYFGRNFVLQQYLEQLMLVALAVPFGPETGIIPD